MPSVHCSAAPVTVYHRLMDFMRHSSIWVSGVNLTVFQLIKVNFISPFGASTVISFNFCTAFRPIKAEIVLVTRGQLPLAWRHIRVGNTCCETLKKTGILELSLERRSVLWEAALLIKVKNKTDDKLL